MTADADSLHAVSLRCPRCRADLLREYDKRILCPACGTEFPVLDGIPLLMADRASNEEWRDYFSGLEADADASRSSYAPGYPAYAEFQLGRLSLAYRHALTRWLRAGSTILDIGCGHGALLGDLSARFRLHGVDFIIGSLRVAKDRGYSAYQADAAALPFPDEEFDAVVCAELLQSFAEITAPLAEAVRVCKPGGLVVISTVNRSSLVRSAMRVFTRATRSASAQIPIIRRAPSDVVSSVAKFPVTLEQIAWVQSPTARVAFTAQLSLPMSLFSTNFILCFRRLRSASN